MSKSLGPLKDETTVPENSDLPTPNRYWITWLLWILASTVGFCFSLAPLFILVMFLGYYSAQLSPRYSVIFFIIGASGGLILGLSQWIFLRSKIQKGGIWIIATSISWGLSTFLLFPELIGLSLKTIFQSDYVPAAIGGIVGLCQCLVLRLHVRRASLWILFNIIGYTSAFLLINFISANTVLNFAIFVIAVGIIISMSNGIGFVFLFDKSLQNLKHAGILTGVSLFIVLTFSIPIGIRGNQQLLKIEQYPVTSLAFSPDGKVLAAASIHGEVKLWDVETGQEVNAIKVTSTYDVDIAYSPDGNTIAIVTDRVRLWDLDTGQLGKSFTGSPHGDDSIDFSPDGKVLATLKLYEIFLWDVDDGQIVKKLNLDQSLDSVPSCLAFSPAGDFLAIGQGATVQIWSVETGQELNIFRGFDGWIKSVDISPDGKVVASGANSAEYPVRLWDISSGLE
ncbi:PD40 domain-containing protein, partial [bacterium]|nr:PD40 domain-containing protein [bacterium]